MEMCQYSKNRIVLESMMFNYDFFFCGCLDSVSGQPQNEMIYCLDQQTRKDTIRIPIYTDRNGIVK